MFALAYGGAKIVRADALKYKLPDQKLRVVSFSNGIRSGGTEVTGVFNTNSSQVTGRRGILAVSLVCDIEPKNISSLIASFGSRPIYGISTGKVSLTVFTSSEEPERLIGDLHQLDLCKALSCRSNVGLVELNDPVFVDSPGWIAKISGALASEHINIIEVTTSKSTINIFVDESKIEDAEKVVRDALET